jgi:hypothetical protein
MRQTFCHKSGWHYVARTSASLTFRLYHRSLSACLALSTLKEVDCFHFAWDETVLHSFHILYALYCIVLTTNFSSCHTLWDYFVFTLVEFCKVLEPNRCFTLVEFCKVLEPNRCFTLVEFCKVLEPNRCFTLRMYSYFFFILTFIPWIFSYVYIYIYIYTISQQMHYSDSLLVSYSCYMFRRMYVIIRGPSFVCPAELH